MTTEHEQRATITAELRRLWQEAKDWKANGFPGEPIVVRLRNYDAQAKPLDLIDIEGKTERGLKFRLTWNGATGECYVDIFVSIHPEGDSFFSPSGGVRILTGNTACRTEGDIFWGEFKDVRAVSVTIGQYCTQQIERACRHKNENKFFRYKKPVAT
jgi:hypothetical protein